MKSKEEVEAPWLSVETSVEYLALTFRIHDVLVYVVFKACNVLEPMPYLISFLNNIHLETLSNAFSMSSHPMCNDIFRCFVNIINNLIIKIWLIVDLSF